MVLTAVPDKNAYEAHLVDPEKARFTKGSVLIFNLATQTGFVSFGSGEKSIEAEKRLMVQPTPDKNGMYRMTASYLDAGGKNVQCYDRYVSDNPNSRNLLFLLPGESTVLKVLSIPLFGELD